MQLLCILLVFVCFVSVYAYHFSSYHIVCCSLVHVYYGSFVNELPLISLYSCFLFTGFFFFWGGGGRGQTTRESTHVLFKILFQSFFFFFFFFLFLFTLYNAFCLSQEITFYLFFLFSFFLLLYASCCFVDNLLFRGNNIGD